MRLLNEAQALCDESDRLFPQDPGVKFDRGWIRDEFKDYEGAEAAYLEAKRLDPEGKLPAIRYNLACTYTKWGNHQRQAFAEICGVLDADSNAQDAAVDPDLQGLLDDPEFGPQLRKLIEERKKHQPFFFINKNLTFIDATVRTNTSGSFRPKTASRPSFY